MGYGRYWDVANQNVETPWIIDIIRFLISLESFTDNVFKLNVKFTIVYSILQKTNKILIKNIWLFEEVDKLE